MSLDGAGALFVGVNATAATVATIGAAIALSVTRSRKKHVGVSMIGIDHKGELVIPQQAFQWWPENIQDTLAVGWQFKAIPGGSHSLAQWGSNTGRSFSMELKLTRNMRYLEDFQAAGPFGDVPLLAKFVDPDGPRSLAHNVDIRRMVRYLRAYCYPDYDADQDGIALPPVVCMLNVPGLQLNEDGGDTVRCVMTGCDVTYQKSFSDGKPRLATVGLGFSQIVQTADDGVIYKTRKDLLDSIDAGLGSGAGALARILGSGNPVPVTRDFNKIENT